MKNTIVLLLFPFLMFGQTQIGEDIDGEYAFDNFGKNVSLSSDGNIIAIAASGNDNIGTGTGQVRVFKNIDGNWVQIGNDINGEENDFSGRGLSLSYDGTIVAIGAPGNDDIGNNSGKVRVYENIAGNWEQIGNDINGETGDALGESVSLSSDGNFLAIGAPTANVNSDALGSVRIYENVAGSWEQVGNDIDGEGASDFIGYSISLSSDGSIIAIGTSYNDDNGMFAGHARIFENIAGNWVQIGDDIDGEAAGDFFGGNIDLSSDGTIIAIGARFNDGNGINSGHVRIYKYINGVWEQTGEDIVGEAAGDTAGSSVRLSSDGSIVAIGARNNDGGGEDSGHVRIFKNVEGNWIQIAADIDGEAADDDSGRAISLSSDGDTIAIGVQYNDGNGINSGHVRVYDILEFVCIFSCIDIEVVLDENGEASIFNDDILSNDSSSNLSYSISASQFNCDNIGDNSIIITATNTNEIEATCEAVVTVVDNSPPIFECLDDITVVILENENYIVPDFINEEGIEITDNCNVDTISQYPVEGTLIPAGTIETITITAVDFSGNTTDCVFQLNVDEILNVNNISLDALVIYPNPASKNITIKLIENQEVSLVNIFNNLGQLVQTETTTSIDISGLVSGSYYVQVTTSEGVSAEKLLVE